jgi:hypothetical protein
MPRRVSLLPLNNPFANKVQALSSPSSSTTTPLIVDSTSSTNHAWIAGIVVGPVVAICLLFLIAIFILRRRKQRTIAELSTQGIENNLMDKPQLHADSLPRKKPSELVGSGAIPPAELPAREEVATEIATSGHEMET